MAIPEEKPCHVLQIQWNLGPLSGPRTIVCSVNTDAHFRVLIRAAEYFSVNETISQQEESHVRSSRKNCFCNSNYLSVILTNQKPKLFELFCNMKFSKI